jgi:flagellum-specific peptidoglycan hydrolase FlgJ
MTKQEFLAAAVAAARASSAVSGFAPGITVAQAALESNFGLSQLARLANNYFGIKLRPGLPSIELPTLEFIAGRPRRLPARFAVFASMEECFFQRDRLLGHAACYSEARACAADPQAFTRALAAHWATDPKYADKVLSVWRRNGLHELDAAAPSSTASA